ncbi:GNAT family N-acetyltransferase [Clostridium hydrogenum]|uniref:GNAT family N-acetyltransferase n=1 Tax=Clostridium hydrogenum TaxID=2855764 RepID=UPI001F487987|nr:GNAT family N-acetyltransferase [Clostridium hydrogenum]
MVELRKVTFGNYNKVLQLKPEEYQKEYVEDISTTLALAYAGINEKCPGELCIIYYENEPVGVILVGRSEIGEQEPKVLKKYKFVYRFIGFFIDYKYQNKGIGKKAFKLALDKVKAYPDGEYLPIALEVKVENANAIKLYESFGFHDSGIRYGDDCAFIRLPQNN